MFFTIYKSIGDKPMLKRKVLKVQDSLYVAIPKQLCSLIGIKKGDTLYVKYEQEKIIFAPVQTAKPELSRNVQVNEGGKATSGNRSPIIEARDNGKITTGDNSPIHQENIFIQLFWSKGTIGGAIIVIVLNIIYYFWRKKKKTL